MYMYVTFEKLLSALSVRLMVVTPSSHRLLQSLSPPSKVRDVILSSTSVGARHRDHLVTGNVAGGVGDALVEHFFGVDRQGKLTVDIFGEFHRMLRTELLQLEVHVYIHMYRVEPLNNGHSGDRILVHCREVVPILEVMPVGGKQFVRSTARVYRLLGVSIIGVSTVYTV